MSSYVFNPFTGKLDAVNDATPVISKTHAELATLIAGNLLVIGQQYELTDYYTKYVQPLTGKLKVGSGDYGSVNPDDYFEPLILTAISPSTFDSIAVSSKYPGEKVVYEFDNSNVLTHCKKFQGDFSLTTWEGKGIILRDADTGIYYILLQRYSLGQPLSDTTIWRPIFADTDDLTRPGYIRRRMDDKGNDIPFDCHEIQIALAYPSFKLTNDTPSAPYDMDEYAQKTEQESFDFSACTNAGLSGQYFTISSTTTDYYVWFNDLEGSSTDPAPAGLTPIQVNYYSISYPLDTTMYFLASSMPADFSATYGGTVFYSTVVIPGPPLNPSTPGTTASTITITQAGLANGATAGHFYKYWNGSAFDIYFCVKDATTEAIDNTQFFGAVWYSRYSNQQINQYFYHEDVPVMRGKQSNLFGVPNEKLDIDMNNVKEHFVFTDSDGLDHSFGATNYKIGNSQDNEISRIVFKNANINASLLNIANGVDNVTMCQGFNTFFVDIYNSYLGRLAYNDSIIEECTDMYAVDGLTDNKLLYISECYFGKSLFNCVANQQLSNMLVTGDCRDNFYKYGLDTIMTCGDEQGCETGPNYNNNNWRKGIRAFSCGDGCQNNDIEQEVKRVTAKESFAGNIGTGTNAIQDMEFKDAFADNQVQGMRDDTIESNVTGCTFPDGFERNKVPANISGYTFPAVTDKIIVKDADGVLRTQELDNTGVMTYPLL